MCRVTFDNIRWQRIAILFMAILIYAGNGNCSEKEAEVDVKVERVALFKNGLGFFTSSATLPRGATTIRLKQLPVPSHGTFWVDYPSGLEVDAIYTNNEEVSDSISAQSITDILQVNSGKEVTIRTNIKDMPTVSGTIYGTLPENQYNRSYPLAIINSENNIVVLNSLSILQAEFEDETIETSIPRKFKMPAIRLELENEANGEEIGISYLARGITWTPSYLIDISDSKTATFSAKAIIINEVAELENVDLNLVTGYPNIKFGDINSPIAKSESLAGFLNSITAGKSPWTSGQNRDFDLVRQKIGAAGYDEFKAESEQIPFSPEYSTAIGGVESEDLFLYPIKNFTLHNSETAAIPLFSKNLPYKHIYVWEIEDILDDSERYWYNPYNKVEPKEDEVWHSCRLVNDHQMPLTTAAVEFIKDGQFVGQDKCYYTAPGAETTIRINRAMNLIADKSEIELERQHNAAIFYGSHFDLVKIEGKLRLKNRLSKSIDVEVTKKLSGKVISTMPQAGDKQTAKRLQKVNPRHLLMWEINLDPDEKITLSYTYEVYIRN